MKDREQGMFEYLFETLMTGNSSQAILNQEKRGQAEFTHSETMPHDGDWETLEAWGVVQGEAADDLFAYCTLPDGWKKVATDHSMHSDLVDDKGRKRAGIFYKAAFYDRSAHFSTNTRYNATYQPVGGWEEYNHGDKDALFEGIVKDGDEIIWRSKPLKKEDYDTSSVLTSLAKTWLYEKYPDWQNKLAYWD